jgi:hypothetical protein
MLDYNACINSVVEALERFNTTSAGDFDLSAGLSTRVRTIAAGDPEMMNGRGDKFPAVIVNLASKTQDINQLGVHPATGTQTRFALVDYDVWCMYKKEGHSKTDAELMADSWRFSDNVENVLAKNFTFSGTALCITAIDADFTPKNENTLIEISKIRLQARYMYR